MHKSLPCFATLVALGLFFNSHLARGQDDTDQIRGMEFAAAVNLLEKDVKAEGTLFLPQSVRRVHAVIVVLNWGISQTVYQDLNWHRVSETLESGLLHVRISKIGPVGNETPISAQVVRNAAVGGADALFILLQRLAQESAHEELQTAPILLWGHSAAGSFAATFAMFQPLRTIAFIRYHSHLRGLPLDLKVLSQIPALILAGGKDEIAGVEDSQDLWKSGRTISAPWTFAVAPDAAHSSPESLSKANDLMISWVMAVFRQRLSLNGTVLRVVTDGAGWVGNNRTAEVAPYNAFSGSKLETSWLPDEPTARAWRAVLGTTN